MTQPPPDDEDEARKNRQWPTFDDERTIRQIGFAAHHLLTVHGKDWASKKIWKEVRAEAPKQKNERDDFRQIGRVVLAAMRTAKEDDREIWRWFATRLADWCDHSHGPEHVRRKLNQNNANLRAGLQ